jgi:hypothetical protein
MIHSPQGDLGNIAAGAPSGNRSTAAATGACPGKTMRKLKKLGGGFEVPYQFWGNLSSNPNPHRS